MNKFSRRCIAFLISPCIGASYGFSEYIVRDGDTLSEVIQARFPNESIYGDTGKLQALMKLNPHLENPDLIFPNDRILLEESHVTIIEDKGTAPASKSPSSTLDQNVASETDNSDWITSLYYGVRYTKFSQDGNLTGADVGVLLLNEITFNTEYHQNDSTWGLGLNTYSFKYSDSTQRSGSERLANLRLYLAVKWFVAGIGVMEQPIFRNNLGSIELDKQTLTYLKLGYLHRVPLTQLRNTNLKLTANILLPFDHSSSNQDIDITSASSFGFKSEVELERELYFNEWHTLYLTWLTSFNYLTISEDVKWGTQEGSVDIETYGMASSIGLRLKF